MGQVSCLIELTFDPFMKANDSSKLQHDSIVHICILCEKTFSRIPNMSLNLDLWHMFENE